MKNDMDIRHNRLALFGGPKTIQQPFGRYNPIGAEEVRAAVEVIEGGVLSKFIGAWHEDFLGGPKVRAFERAWQSHFGVRHAVSMNSCTSALSAAVGALGIEPGDEVIVSPWTMSASATAIIHWNAIPVFADIERETFNLDPRAVEGCITPHTRAIVAVDIFGHPADMGALRDIARRHGLKLISDSAQAPGARIADRYAGTLADIGCFSLNYHKHIHTGEGGVLVTDDDRLAERARMIRNHAEAVVGGKGETDLVNMVGYNYRLGEIEAAMGIEQLKKLQDRVADRQRWAARLTQGLAGLPGLRTPVVRSDCTHTYYVYPMVLDTALLGVSRDRIYQALVAEGVEHLAPRYLNVHRMPMYQQKIAYGSKGFPWSLARREIDYHVGICPVAEELQDRSYLGHNICMVELGETEVDLVLAAFRKVWSQLEALRT
jgi:dTDP-4-amino-4,6-dideoxygalactose transaminase